MAISFQSDEEALQKLRERLRSMTDAELIQFGKRSAKACGESVSAAVGRGERGVEAEKERGGSRSD